MFIYLPVLSGMVVSFLLSRVYSSVYKCLAHATETWKNNIFYVNKRKNIWLVCQTHPKSNVSRNCILLTSKRSRYKSRKWLILRYFSQSKHHLDERLIVIKRQHRRECIANQYEVAWEKSELFLAFFNSHLDLRLARKTNTLFPQYHAITSDLVTVHRRRAIASWLSADYMKLTQYRALDRSPTYAENTERSRIPATTWLSAPIFKRPYNLSSIYSRHTYVIHERQELYSLENNFTFIVHLHRLILFVN